MEQAKAAKLEALEQAEVKLSKIQSDISDKRKEAREVGNDIHSFPSEFIETVQVNVLLSEGYNKSQIAKRLNSESRHN